MGRQRNWSFVDRARLERLYARGVSPKEISHRMQRSYNSVQKKLTYIRHCVLDLRNMGYGESLRQMRLEALRRRAKKGDGAHEQT